MDNKCPKCNNKLSIFYLKQECPHCGCDLVNYNLEKRLEEDSIKAEAEYEKVNELILKIKAKVNSFASKIKAKFKR